MLVIVLTVSCSDYQKLLKSPDANLKYERAQEYFNQKKYQRALTLFDDVATYYKGTERSQEVLNYIARSYVGMKSYTSAGEYYELYIRNYPKGRYIVEARYMVGHCAALESPDAKLDQTDTHKAIDALTLFLELYPESDYAPQAAQELEQMYDKLALKEYNNAKLYYNLGTYLGNNYESCVIVARNALKKYPGNSYQEELQWLILQSKYQQLLRSVEERKEERAIDTDDECYNFLNEYPQTKHRRAIERIRRDAQKILKN